MDICGSHDNAGAGGCKKNLRKTVPFTVGRTGGSLGHGTRMCIYKQEVR